MKMKPIIEGFRKYLNEAANRLDTDQTPLQKYADELLALIKATEGYGDVKFKKVPTKRSRIIVIDDVGTRRQRESLNMKLKDKYVKHIMFRPEWISDPGITRPISAIPFKKGLYKGIDYTLYAGTSTTELKIANKGDVVEGLLGIALAYMIDVYPKRGIKRSHIIDITNQLDATDNLSQNNAKIHKRLFMKHVQLDIALNAINFHDMVKKEKRDEGLLEGLYTSVIKYATSNYFRNFIEKELRNKDQKLTLKVMGAVEQLESKADLKLFRGDGATTEMIWSHSLKYGSRQLGQVGGKNAENVFGFITKIFDVELQPADKEAYQIILPNPSKHEFYQATDAIFHKVHKHATAHIAKDDYVEYLLSALKHSAIGDESNLDLLNFEKDKFRLLDFGSLSELIGHLSLSVDFKRASPTPQPRGGYPVLTVFDNRGFVVPKKENILFTLRPKYESSGPVLRYYVEYGDLIDHMITKVNEQIKKSTART